MADAIDRILAEEELPPAYRATVERWWAPLAALIAERHGQSDHPLIVGVNGPQGSGKSTLCRFLEALLSDAHGLSAATLSLDDLYLSKAQRQAKAADTHPLFATRGVPGTHEIYLGLRVFAEVLGGGTPLLPRFDKSVDDRAPDDAWHRLERPVDVLLFEGWCVGARPQAEEALLAPVNALEAEEDADGVWRRAVNEALVAPYRALFGPVGFTVMLRPPGFAPVAAWRALQERKLRERTGRGMTEAEVARFVQHYERLTRHMLATLSDHVDVVIDVDAEHQVTGMRGTGRS